ncbi:MAG: hypothetical protein JWQ36_3052 [Enterovirga sp.]|nr:hypothetical protein [Enterovirga sp.]
MIQNGWLDLRQGEEEAELFAHLHALSQTMTTEAKVTGRRFDLEKFDALVDNLALVRPARRFGEFRFLFYGSAFSDASPGGDLNGVPFHDLLGSPYYRGSLAGFWHVHRVGLAHVTRDHPIIGGRKRYFTRLLIPIFAGNTTSLVLCAARLHDEPTIQPQPVIDDEIPLAATA